MIYYICKFMGIEKGKTGPFYKCECTFEHVEHLTNPGEIRHELIHTCGYKDIDMDTLDVDKLPVGPK